MNAVDFLKKVVDKIAELASASGQSVEVSDRVLTWHSIRTTNGKNLTVTYAYNIDPKKKGYVKYSYDGKDAKITEANFDKFDFSEVVNWLCSE